MSYAAFISYSHAADGLLAPALQSALHRLARPWYRLRALHVFRDATNLSAAPELWPRIEEALRASKALVLLASPEAARSKWVRREVEFWRSKPDAPPIFIVVTAGEAVWDAAAGDFDYERSTALPDALRGLYRDEPLWIDLRFAHGQRDLSLKNPAFADAAATLAAALHGVPKETLIGEDIRQHRRTKLIAGTAVAALLVLLATAIAAFLAARQQLDRANRNLADQLATNALNAREGRDTVLIAATAATRLRPTPVAHAALLRLVQRNAQVERLLYPSSQVINIVSLAVSERGSVAAGLYPGGIEFWPAGGTRQEIETSGNAALAFSGERLLALIDGNTLLADGKTHQLPTDCQFFDPFLVPPFAAARDANVIAFASDNCGGATAITVCTLGPPIACRALEIVGLPEHLALTHDGSLLAAAWSNRWQRYRTADFELEITADDHDIVALAPAARSPEILRADNVPKPRFSGRVIAAAATDLRRVAFADSLEGVGLPYVDSSIAVENRTGNPNGRLSRIEKRAGKPPAAPKIELPEVDPETLPPWRDGDDHEVEVAAISPDGLVAATVRNQRGEGISPRIVLRQMKGTAKPVLVDTGGWSATVLAAGSRFIAAALEDATIRLWDRNTGAPASEAFTANGDVVHLAFTANDEHLVVHYADRTETLVTSLAGLQRIACEIANRDLSPDEWRARMASLPYEPVCSTILGRPLEKRW